MNRMIRSADYLEIRTDSWKHCLWLWFGFFLGDARGAELLLPQLEVLQNAIQVGWEGGQGPYVVEVSRDLQNWSAQGDPTTNRVQKLAAFAGQAYYRVRDLDPNGQFGKPFGWIQTEQSEFGGLMAKHRLKTRLGLYLSKGGPHTAASYAPAEYWKKLWVVYQFVEDRKIQTWSGTFEDLGAVATPSNEQLTVRWDRGSGGALRNYTLTLGFPYAVNASRTSKPFPSDPRYTLKCRYASDQPELSQLSASLDATRTDSVDLIELAPVTPQEIQQSFTLRNYTVTKRGVTVSLHFYEGMPLYQGSVPWILKTFPFDRWMAPSTVAGGSLPSFSTDSYFARSVLPGHHNFYEMVLIEPALDPALADETRTFLERSNIRQIYTFKDLAGVVIGGDSQDIRYFGYDNSVRVP